MLDFLKRLSKAKSKTNAKSDAIKKYVIIWFADHRDTQKCSYNGKIKSKKAIWGLLKLVNNLLKLMCVLFNIKGADFTSYETGILLKSLFCKVNLYSPCLEFIMHQTSRRMTNFFPLWQLKSKCVLESEFQNFL